MNVWQRAGLWTLIITWCVNVPLAFAQDTGEASDPETANATVLEVINEMPAGGGYVWKSTGVPDDVMHQDRVVLAKTTADGTYCSGVTFATVVEAATREGLLDDVPFDRVKQFQRDWYGTHDAAAETQCVYAMEQLGIGKAVRPRDAQPGDFVQYWRGGGSGHSVVFIDWVIDADASEPVGLTYWSSQTATDGIGMNVEYFAGHVGPDESKGRVLPDRLYIGRLNTPQR
ncbi:MAG: hypothetical protein AAGF84_02860 [Planctomycetota bacterium]